jgi:hypothetical protein
VEEPTGRPIGRRRALAALGLGALGAAAGGTAIVVSSRSNAPEGPTTASGLPLVTPSWSDALAESIGVNVKYHFKQTAYGNVAAVDALLAELGVRTIRDRQFPGDTSPSDLAHLSTLYSAGIRSHVTLGRADQAPYSDADMDAMLAPVARNPERYVSVGGLNEPNASDRPADWAAVTRDHSRQISDRMGALGIPTEQVKRVAPALRDAQPTLPADFQALQETDIASYLDFGDFHRYPLSQGGTTTTSRVDERLALAQAAFGGLPMYCTETGFNTAQPELVDFSAVPWDVQATLMVKVFCGMFARGVVRTFQYELLDDPDPTNADLESNWGLVAVFDGDLDRPQSWVRKTSFTALRDLIASVADPGTPYSPGPIGLRLSGGPPDLEGLVLQRRDGSSQLLLWRDVPLWDKGSLSRTSVAPAMVTVESDAGGRQRVAVADGVVTVSL